MGDLLISMVVLDPNDLTEKIGNYKQPNKINAMVCTLFCKQFVRGFAPLQHEESSLCVGWVGGVGQLSLQNNFS